MSRFNYMYKIEKIIRVCFLISFVFIFVPRAFCFENPSNAINNTNNCDNMVLDSWYCNEEAIEALILAGMAGALLEVGTLNLLGRKEWTNAELLLLTGLMGGLVGRRVLIKFFEHFRARALARRREKERALQHAAS